MKTISQEILEHFFPTTFSSLYHFLDVNKEITGYHSILSTGFPPLTFLSLAGALFPNSLAVNEIR